MNLNLIATPRHVGQGASQALEDAAYLSHLLRQLPSISGTGRPTSEELVSVFSAFQRARQPRTKKIVEEAHRHGNNKREHSAIGHFVKIWMLKVLFKLIFLAESWLDELYGYQVPGLEDWSDYSKFEYSE
jgi:2-polyprenyl-6-methoxyphenol hydroxylase-like FAD-dependent oxidoreductase